MARRCSVIPLETMICVVLALSACDKPVDPAMQCEEYPGVSSGQSRRYELIVREGERGQRWYTVQDKTGHVIAGCIGKRQLRSQYPEAAEASDVVSRALRTPQFGYVE